MEERTRDRCGVTFPLPGTPAAARPTRHSLFRLPMELFLGRCGMKTMTTRLKRETKRGAESAGERERDDWHIIHTFAYIFILQSVGYARGVI